MDICEKRIRIGRLNSCKICQEVDQKRAWKAFKKGFDNLDW